MPKQLTPPNQAIEEIKHILKKHDLAGMVFVVGEHEGAFLHKIDPSWSAAFFEHHPGGTTIRVKAKKKDFPDRTAHKRIVELTVGMVMFFKNQATRSLDQMTRLAAMLREYVDFAHWEKENDDHQ